MSSVQNKIDTLEGRLQEPSLLAEAVKRSKNGNSKKRKGKKSEIPNGVRAILEKAGFWVESSVFLSTPFCFIFFTLFCLGFGFNYFGITSLAFILSCVGGALLVAGMSAVIRLVRYTLYLTFADSGSKLLKILTVAFIMSTLTTGPVFRLWSTASTIPASLKCTQEVTEIKIGDVLEDFKRSLITTISENLQSWNAKTQPIQAPFRTLGNLIRGIGDGLQVAKGKVRNALQECESGLKKAGSDCKGNTDRARRHCNGDLDNINVKFKETAEDVGKKLNPVNWFGKRRRKRGLSALCDVVKLSQSSCGMFDVNYCAAIKFPDVALDFHSKLAAASKHVESLLDISFKSAIKAKIDVDKGDVSKMVNETRESIDEIYNKFQTSRSIFSYMALFAIIISTALNIYHLIRKTDNVENKKSDCFTKLKKRIMKAVSEKSKYVTLICLSGAAIYLYTLDILLHYSYCSLSASMANGSIPMKTKSGMSMEVEGGALGKLIGNLILGTFNQVHQTEVELEFKECFQACSVQISWFEFLGCSIALLFLYFSILLRKAIASFKFNIIQRFHEHQVEVTRNKDIGYI